LGKNSFLQIHLRKIKTQKKQVVLIFSLFQRLQLLTREREASGLPLDKSVMPELIATKPLDHKP
jgi:hypothetical protein